MKSKRRSDEICFADEIKSVHLPTSSDFITQVISSTKGGFIPSIRTDLAEKSTVTVLFSGVDEWT